MEEGEGLGGGGLDEGELDEGGLGGGELGGRGLRSRWAEGGTWSSSVSHVGKYAARIRCSQLVSERMPLGRVSRSNQMASGVEWVTKMGLHLVGSSGT